MTAKLNRIAIMAICDHYPFCWREVERVFGVTYQTGPVGATVEILVRYILLHRMMLIPREYDAEARRRFSKFLNDLSLATGLGTAQLQEMMALSFVEDFKFHSLLTRTERIAYWWYSLKYKTRRQ